MITDHPILDRTWGHGTSYSSLSTRIILDEAEEVKEMRGLRGGEVG